MENDWLNEAVFNNATWCDAMAASHGVPTSWNETVWFSTQPMPPLYPNIITLRAGTQIDEQVTDIRPQLPLDWAIKDSFSELELEGKGFALAFEAHWYCRVPNQNATIDTSPKLCVETVKTYAELNRWVTAWGGKEGIFNTLLPENSDIEPVDAAYEQSNSFCMG